ncbi:MAG: hypothetical protein Tsb0013_12110 [Phycisphaerales bacterium]
MRLREHYERAFAWYLRENRVPYISVDEAKRALLPSDASMTVNVGAEDRPRTLKNFDFVAYTSEANYLVDIKGRKVSGKGTGEGRLESWVTQGDVDSLAVWESLFNAPDDGPGGFRGAFVFLYWLASPPPDGLFQEIFDFEGRWYAVRSVELSVYVRRMKVRSPKWGTVDLPTKDFRDCSRPFFGLTSRTVAASPSHD